MNFSFIQPGPKGISESEAKILHALPRLRSELIPTEEACDVLEHCYNLLICNDELKQNLGLSVICHISNNLPKDPMVRFLLSDCISACRNFLYSEMLDRRYGEDWRPQEKSDLELFQENFYKTDSGTTLTKQQHELMQIFRENPRLVVSAPTSFGKTRLLQEIILEKGYKSIALVMPTIALISETVRRFREDDRFEEFAILNATSASVGTDKYIFVLTPEKLDLLLEENPTAKFDFFAMDEIYKIQDDSRKAVFANVLYQMSKSGADFYLIGPYFKKFSHRFLDRNKANFQHYTLEIVQKDEIPLQDYSSGDAIEIDGTTIFKAKTDFTNLKRVISALKDQRLIYHATKRGTESVAKGLSKLVLEEKKRSNLIDYIEENISKKWALTQCLEKGVAFHHGAMPRYIQSALVDSFNSGDLSTLVCTTTLTEGVNTTAKNVILYSNKKGAEPLTGFDFKNIKGRAGRFLHHFVGRVITFHEVAESEKDLISFHFYDNDDLSSDEVLFIDETDLLPEAREKRERVINLLDELDVPVSVIRKNKYITVEKQLALIRYFRDHPDLVSDLEFHGNLPNIHQLDTIFDLLHTYIFSESDHDDKNFTFPNLKRLIKFYVYKKPSLKEIIASQDASSEDTKIRRAFYLISHYFEFSLPKYLNCFQSLFNYAFGTTEGIRLKFLATMLQYGFTEAHEIALKEAGLPDELISKVSKKLKECRTFEEIRLKIRIDPKVLDGLNEFETALFRKSL